MAVQIPFPLPASGYALNSKVRINLDYIVSKFNEFNTGTATWDTVAVGTAGALTGSITLWNASNLNYLTLQPGVTVTSITYTLPITAPTSSVGFPGNLLMVDSAGTMKWTTHDFSSLDSASHPGVVFRASGSTYSVMNNITGGRGFVAAPAADATPPQCFQLLGTSNQITITHNASDSTFSLPQDITTTSSVKFGVVTLPGGGQTAPSILLGTVSGLGDRAGFGFYDDASYLYTVGYLDTNPGQISTTLSKIDHSGNIINTGNVTLASTKSFIVTDSGSNTISVKAPTTVISSYTLTLPVNDGNANDVLTTDGSGVLSWNPPASTGANTALSNLAAVAINTTLVSDTANTDDLGTSAIPWKSGYFKTSLILQETGAGTDAITISAPSALTAGYTLILPTTAGSSNQFLQTNGSGTLNWASAATAALDNLASVAINTSLISDTDNTDDLGSSSKAWKNVYYAGVLTGGQGFITSSASDIYEPNLILRDTQALAAGVGGAISFGGKYTGSSYTEWAAIRGAKENATDPDYAGRLELYTRPSGGSMTKAVNISSAGEITQPLQPSFLVTHSAGDANVTGDGTQYTVAWGNEIYDQGADFASNTFTAPVTGRYELSATVTYQQSTASHTSNYIIITTSNRDYIFFSPITTANDRSLTLSVIADMDASDIARVILQVSGSTKVVDMMADARFSTFSGSLIN